MRLDNVESDLAICLCQIDGNKSAIQGGKNRQEHEKQTRTWKKQTRTYVGSLMKCQSKQPTRHHQPQLSIYNPKYNPKINVAKMKHGIKT